MDCYYLINTKKTSKAAHMFDGYDTVCKSWSKGGIKNMEDYEMVEDVQGRKICGMCINNKKGKKGK